MNDKINPKNFKPDNRDAQEIAQMILEEDFGPTNFEQMLGNPGGIIDRSTDIEELAEISVDYFEDKNFLLTSHHLLQVLKLIAESEEKPDREFLEPAMVVAHKLAMHTSDKESTEFMDKHKFEKTKGFIQKDSPELSNQDVEALATEEYRQNFQQAQTYVEKLRHIQEEFQALERALNREHPGLNLRITNTDGLSYGQGDGTDFQR